MKQWLGKFAFKRPEKRSCLAEYGLLIASVVLVLMVVVVFWRTAQY